MSENPEKHDEINPDNANINYERVKNERNKIIDEKKEETEYYSSIGTTNRLLESINRKLSLIVVFFIFIPLIIFFYNWLFV